jgi:serine phosphatase RsbU (regulator of sigma subunit)/anti-sigma regulatory factor (Ser/Thr protein kinase)
MELRNAFISILRKAVGYLAESSQAALAYVSPAGNQHWIVTSEGCPCSQQPGQEARCLTGCKAAGRRSQSLPLWYKNRNAGSLIVCCPAFVHPAIEATLCQTAVGTLRQLELEKENEALRAEVSAVKEGLQAVYHLSPSLCPAPKRGELLEHILTQVVAVHRGLRAVLWVVSGGRLEPRASKNAPPCAPRAAGDGLLGRVLASAEPLLAPGRAELAALAPAEPELARATGAALVPVCGGGQVLGILEVWQEEGPLGLDARARQLLTTLGFLAATAAVPEPAIQPSRTTEVLRQDMETASRIQRTLFLGRPAIDLKSQIRADAISVPSREVGGDFYDFFAYDQVLDVVVGDVMGKGMPAALVGAATKYHLVRAINYLLASHPERLPDPKDVLAIVNAEVFRHFEGIETFVTLCYARFDLRQGQARIIDCGHTKSVHVCGDGDRYDLLQGENMPLGFSRGDVYKELTVPLDGAGDVFFFYTDGVTEARKGGEGFGEERLARLVASLRWLDPRELVDRVGAEVLAFAGSKSPGDDLTCVAVKTDPMRSLVSKRASVEIFSDLKYLPRAQAFLTELCRQGLDVTGVATDLAELQQAVAEVLKHIVLHAYCGQPDKRVRVEASLFGNRLSVRIYHRGEPFDPETVVTSSSGAKAAALPAVRRRVDAVHCSRSTHGEHCVHLQKWLKQ